LGDIVFSTPTVVTSPANAYDRIYIDQTYNNFVAQWKQRQGMVYIGANDGMLHAFRAGRYIVGDDPATAKVEGGYYAETNLGSEAWAYVPFNLLPHLKWLADPDYTHVYYVDLKMKVMDVKIFVPDSSVHIDGWGSLLVGGMRLGGGPYPSQMTDGSGNPRTFLPAYFLIDVTDPENPEVLAEFTHPQMGFTTSYPAITKVQDHWYLIVGSGPTPGSTPPYRYDGTSDQVAKIFVLDLTQFMFSRQIRQGQELYIFDGVDTNAFMADPISVDMPKDYSTDVIYIGETYWGSNIWNGRMYRLLTNNSTNPSTWQLSTLFQTSRHQTITAAPSASVGFNNDLWVFFGTGRYFGDPDKTDTNTQAFYGIRDGCMEGKSCETVSGNDLLDVTDLIVSSDKTVSGSTVADTFSELESKFRGTSPTYHGWKTDLVDTGERSLSKPRVLGGSVLFTTFIPNPDICSIGGDGKLYALYFLTGTAHFQPTIGLNESYESLKSTDLGKGMPASLGIHVGTKEVATGFVQTSTGNIIQKDVYLPLTYRSGTISWRQQ
jgi:type IV pilus assembly protein PilY1